MHRARTMESLRTGVLAAGICVAAVPLLATASDHNEPASDPVWPADRALHAEWDISDLFGWYDRDTDRFNIIVAWHPQQLPRDAGQRTDYSDQVLYTVHMRYERSGAQISSRDLEREITVRYGANDAGEWGMLVTGLPGLPPQVLDCESESGWRGHDLAVETTDGEDTVSVATGTFDDPFVFDLDGYNASLTRALNGETGLRFDPENDTFEGHNITAFVLSIPVKAFEEHWEDFDRDGSVLGTFPTEELHLWATTRITDAEVAREAKGEQ